MFLIAVKVSLVACYNSHASTFPSDVEINEKLESGDNSTSDHTVVVDPDQLIGPQVIDMIMNKPGMIRCLTVLFSILFLNRIFISDQILQFVIPEFNS